jgi:antitoxin CptB|tara:strand:+ start:347 stop:598 length:252 start_codon:yes stop_codon:yes gene_type:complete
MKSLKYNQLYWRSRRGMLELDLQLQPFLEQSFSSLEDSEKEGYEKLLLEEDWQIYDWLRGVTTPVDKNVALVVDKIMRFQLEK